MVDLVLVKIDANAGRSGLWGGRAFRLGVHRYPNVSQEDADKLVAHFGSFYGAKPERLARLEHAALFEDGGPYHGDHPVLGARDVRREGEQPAEGAPADVGGDAEAAPVPERGEADGGGGRGRAEADGRPDPGTPRHGERELLSVPEDVEEDGSIEAQPIEPAEGPDVEEVGEVAAEEAPVAQTVPDGPAEAIDLAEAVGYLDPADDSHWSPQGLPSLDAITGILGRKPMRREVDAVAPGYTRSKAAQAKQ